MKYAFLESDQQLLAFLVISCQFQCDSISSYLCLPVQMLCATHSLRIYQAALSFNFICFLTIPLQLRTSVPASKFFFQLFYRGLCQFVIRYCTFLKMRAPIYVQCKCSPVAGEEGSSNHFSKHLFQRSPRSALTLSPLIQSEIAGPSVVWLFHSLSLHQPSWFSLYILVFRYVAMKYLQITSHIGQCCCEMACKIFVSHQWSRGRNILILFFSAVCSCHVLATMIGYCIWPVT